jgi:three-Cys-motif partner protein
MKLDEIGEWSEIKLEIIRKYASAFTTIMKNQKWCKGYVYIDAFAGAGVHISRKPESSFQVPLKMHLRLKTLLLNTTTLISTKKKQNSLRCSLMKNSTLKFTKKTAMRY